MRHIQTEGIILKKNNFGEHDQYVSIFTPFLGKIDAIAKGARKLTSPFMGHLETLNICKFQLYKSSNTHTITQCQSTKTYAPLRCHFEKTIQAILIGEILHHAAHGQEHNQNLFSLIEKTLSHLCSSKKNSLCLESFKIKLLNELGVMPHIGNCSICNRRWQDNESALIGKDGHIACHSCRLEKFSYRTIPFNIIKLINYIGLADFVSIEKITLEEGQRHALKYFSDIFLNQFINKELVTEKIISAF